MSADIIPMPPPHEPAPPSNITPLPQAVTTTSTSKATAPPASVSDTLSQLLKNPFVLAGGALLAGMALTRLFATPSMQKLARDLAEEALRRARMAPADEKPAAPSLLEEAVEAVRPQITDAARSFLAQILKKP